jgi:hypothetical protein
MLFSLYHLIYKIFLYIVFWDALETIITGIESDHDDILLTLIKK